MWGPATGLHSEFMNTPNVEFLEGTCLQRAYVIPCRQQMGSSAVKRARGACGERIVLDGGVASILALWRRGRLQNVSPPSVLFQSSRIFYNTQETQTQK